MVVKKWSFILVLAFFFTACSSKNSTSNSVNTSADLNTTNLNSSTSLNLSAYSEKITDNLRINLSNSSGESFKNVFVNVNHVELLLEGKGRSARLIFGENLGVIDLMTFPNGILFPIADLNIPEAVSVKQIRLILNESGHSVQTLAGDTCQMQTPSAQKSGIKIILKDPILFEANYNYSLVLDFNTDKSIVIKGNGGCLLKPVLKLKSATKIALSENNDSSSTSSNDNGDSSTTGNDLTSDEVIDLGGDIDSLPDWDAPDSDQSSTPLYSDELADFFY